MDNETQQDIFVREMDKRLEQLTDELDIDHLFLLGWLQRAQWRVQQDLDAWEMRDELGEGDETTQ
jgi:hypothetical protein